MRKFIFEKRKYGFELLMDLHKFEDNPNVFFDPNPHTIDFFEIFLFENATGKLELNGYTLPVTPYSIFFISPFQKKSCNIPLEGVKGFHLVFQNDFLSDFFNDKLFIYRLQYFYNAQHPQYLKIKKEDYGIVQLVLQEIIKEIKAYQNDSPHIIRSLLYFSLSKLNRLYAQEYHLSDDTQSNSMIYKFKELLELNIRKVHSVQQYADILQVNRHQLNTLAKKHFGKTSKEVIHQRLLQEIKMELRYSDKTIAEIAFALNFSEPNNLTRFFRNFTNTSPVTYRATYQNDRFLP
ncbi:AraC family transcriptional regulator [Aquimarina sp. D1M17]|uniref:helix-turn-helix domain-containing protein n=1 Tax=Aquimarina acroporae TaxID=2937283 RepID=UPI0020C158F6|nr:AraC family transcriptional regulator [Aquimarina acroporae]MCK8524138.1 AraC family transcriptional regulator [Aquimarina acroporae]